MRNIETKFEDDFFRFLKCMEKADCLNDIIIIGSWAEYLYEKCDVIKQYEANMQTIDLDILIPDENRTGARKPLVEIAREEGFLYDEDRLTGATRFIGLSQFEVEFLTPQRGDGSRKLPRTILGVNAQQLTHLDMLKNDTIHVQIQGMKFRIPSPEAYVLHKMIINERRGEKAKKDRDKIKLLIPYLNLENFEAQKQLLTRKENKMYESYCATANDMLEPLKQDFTFVDDSDKNALTSERKTRRKRRR